MSNPVTIFAKGVTVTLVDEAPPVFNFPALALTVGAATDLDQYVSSPSPLTWTPQDTPEFSLTAAGVFTVKAAGTNTINVEVDNGR